MMMKKIERQNLPKVPEGYKVTESGMIPNDWEEISLNSIVSVLEAGVSVNSVDEIDAYSHGKHILKTSCVFNGHFDGCEKKSILPNDVKRAKCSPVKEAIIVSRMNTPNLVGEIGYVAKDDRDVFLPDRLWQMKIKKDIDVNPKWLAALLSFSPFSKKIKDTATGTSGSMKNISKTAFLSLKLPWPTLKEQNVIAKALSDTDELISAIELLIAKKQAIKTSTMQQLLTGRTRLPQFAQYSDGTVKGFKISEQGQIPEDWNYVAIGEFTDCTAGGTPLTSNQSYWGGTNPWMSSGELHLRQIYDVAERITDEGLANSSTKYIPINSVLIGLAGQGKTRGTVAIARISLCTNQSIAAIFPSNKHSTEYLYYNLYSRYDELRSLSTGDGGRGGLNLNIIRALLIPFPNIQEQTAIAHVLSDMDAELVALEHKLSKVRDIKQGMMQQLLTGRIRLPLAHQP